MVRSQSNNSASCESKILVSKPRGKAKFAPAADKTYSRLLRNDQSYKANHMSWTLDRLASEGKHWRLTISLSLRNVKTCESIYRCICTCSKLYEPIEILSKQGKTTTMRHLELRNWMTSQFTKRLQFWWNALCGSDCHSLLSDALRLRNSGNSQQIWSGDFGACIPSI